MLCKRFAYEHIFLCHFLLKLPVHEWRSNEAREKWSLARQRPDNNAAQQSTWWPHAPRTTLLPLVNKLKEGTWILVVFWLPHSSTFWSQIDSEQHEPVLFWHDDSIQSLYFHHSGVVGWSYERFWIALPPSFSNYLLLWISWAKNLREFKSVKNSYGAEAPNNSPRGIGTLQNDNFEQLYQTRHRGGNWSQKCLGDRSQK